MAAFAGVGFLFIILMFGSGLIISSIIGLIFCNKVKKREEKNRKRILKIFLWIILSVGIVVIAISMMYFYLIISNW
ncbi:MAG: hypothetical protein ACI4WY_05350 [Anaerovoracaceae bacterium]